MSDVRLHHHAIFDLHLADETKARVLDPLYSVRAWVLRLAGGQGSETANRLHLSGGTWFFNGGSRSDNTARINLQVDRHGKADAEADHPVPLTWGVRIQHPDREHQQRQWIIDIGLMYMDHGGWRVSTTTSLREYDGYLGDPVPDPTPTSPLFVRWLIGNDGWEGRCGSVHLTADPLELEVGHGHHFAEMLGDENRICPIVFAEGRGPDESRPINLRSLARATCGAAVVYWSRDPEVKEELQHLLPGAYQNRPGSIRVYAPGLYLDDASTARRSRYESAKALGQRTPEKNLEMFARAVSRTRYGHIVGVVKTVDDIHWMRRTNEFRRLSDQLKAGASPEERSELEQLRAFFEEEANAQSELQKKLKAAHDQVEELRLVLEDANEKARSVAAQNDALRQSIEAQAGTNLDTVEVPPTTYEEMPDWVDDRLAGRLSLHQRARRTLKKAVYNDVDLVYNCLLLLAREYRDMKMGINRAKEEFERKCGELEVHIGGSITRTRAGEEGETYFVKYPPGSDQKRFIDLHLRKGTTKDDQLCLAIYFFYDKDKEEVVVCSLPAHLGNRAS